MSKYSGLFLSFLLIFICLWINICRYPQSWKMANGGEAPAPGGESEPVKSDDILETNFKPYTDAGRIAETNAAEEGSWPKPVIITSKVSSGEENPDLKEALAENAGPAEDSSFQTVSMTSAPEEQKEVNTSVETDAPKDGGKTAEEPSKDGCMPAEESSKDENIQKEETPSAEGDLLKGKSGEENNGSSEEKKPEENQEKEEDGSLQVHSSYMAAEFPEGKSPLNSDSPSYDVK